jgi:murein DD-endopeptidase MepM/ murein hydrolase activator NlpD
MKQSADIADGAESSKARSTFAGHSGESDKSVNSARRTFMKREFCIWVVPPQNGRVRKIRFSWRHIVSTAVAVSALIAVIGLVAGDYVRVQAIRAKNYIAIKSIRSQLESFKSENQHLSSKVESLNGAHARVENYEAELRKRVDKLGSVLKSATSIGLIDGTDTKGESASKAVSAAQIESATSKLSARKSNSAKSEEGGLGGLELDCLGGELAGCIESISEALPDSLPENDIGSRLNQATALNVRHSSLGTSNELLETLESYTALLRSIPLGYPVSGEINSGFGLRISPFSGRPKMHQGVDFSLPRGSYIYATAYGTVRKVERSGTYGLRVDIDHGHGIVTRYAHLSRALVKEGQKIERGQIVGHVGSTGHSTGPHLHYEVRLGDKAKNPNRFMDLAYRLNSVMEH